VCLLSFNTGIWCISANQSDCGPVVPICIAE
jgi:hypothetical protein